MERVQAENLNSSRNSGKLYVIRRWIFILKLVGTANWYQGVDKPSFWQWLYKWRVSWRTAYKVAMILYPANGV